jgi:tripartite-type tricarboxylate transporter receptor subunit TctC
MKRTLKLLLTLVILLSVVTYVSQESLVSAAELEGIADEEKVGSTTWPETAVEVLVGANPGGDSDFNCRTISANLNTILSRPFVTVNVPGGGGAIAFEQFFSSKADGSTMLMAHTGFLTNYLSGKIAKSPRDIEIACGFSQSAGDILVVNAKSGWKITEDLVEAARNNPGTISLAGDVGSTSFYEAMMFINSADVEFNLVAGGDAATKTLALLSGECDVTVLPYGNVKEYLKSGDFVALGMFNDTRNELFPDIPTLLEQGFDSTFVTVYFLAFPEGTDQAIIDKCASTVRNICENSQEYADTIYEAFAQVPVFRTKAEILELFDDMSVNLKPLFD